MKLKEIQEIIDNLNIQIPDLQIQLHQALGYKRALLDLEQEEESKNIENKLEKIND